MLTGIIMKQLGQLMNINIIRGPLIKLDNKTDAFHVIAVNSSKVKSSIADNIGYSVPINLFKIVNHKQIPN